MIKYAEVTITNKATGASRTVNTNDAGEYRFDLQPGIYTVKATAKGFSSGRSKEPGVLCRQDFDAELLLNPAE